MRVYIIEITGSRRPHKADIVNPFFFIYLKQKTTSGRSGNPATIYKTESQLFPKKRRVKLQKHFKKVEQN